MSFDPGKVMAEVEAMAERLERAADVYHDTIARYEQAEADYELAMAKGRLSAEATAPDEKWSAEKRQDYAYLALDDGVRNEYRAAKAAKEAQGVRFRALLAAVSARQSLLKALSGH